MSRSMAAVLGAVPFLGAIIVLGFVIMHRPALADALDRGTILQMLADGRFDELDRRLNEIDDEANAQKRPEADLQQAFNAFATSDPAVVTQLDRWVTERPNSGMALVARGVNRFHLVRIMRYAEAFRAANANFAMDLKIKERDAFVDAQKGLAIREMNPVGFVWSLELFIDWGQPQEVEKWYRIAINDLPASPAIHRAYLSSYTPWRQAGASWQDSLVRLKEITESLQKGFGKDPDFAWLAGYLDYVKGETYRLDGQPAEAVKNFDAALAASDDAEYRLGRARAYLALGDGKMAESDFTQILSTDPYFGPAVHGRALAKESLGQVTEALADLDRAVALDPMNPLYLTDRARMLRKLDRIPEARQDIDNALQFGGNDAWVQVWRGAIYESVGAKTSSDAFQQAIALAPADPAYLKRYADFLLRQEDCSAIDVVARYDEICQSGGSCGDQPYRLESAAAALKSKMSCAR
jgi:tetratricopeptide (TPR) repeat protein